MHREVSGPGLSTPSVVERSGVALMRASWHSAAAARPSASGMWRSPSAVPAGPSRVCRRCRRPTRLSCSVACPGPCSPHVCRFTSDSCVAPGPVGSCRMGPRPMGIPETSTRDRAGWPRRVSGMTPVAPVVKGWSLLSHGLLLSPGIGEAVQPRCLRPPYRPRSTRASGPDITRCGCGSIRASLRVHGRWARGAGRGPP